MASLIFLRSQSSPLLIYELQYSYRSATNRLNPHRNNLSINAGSLRIVQARCLHLDELLRNDKEQLNEDQAALEEVQKKMADLSIQYHQVRNLFREFLQAGMLLLHHRLQS